MTVTIVIVSHSAQLAAGVRDLAAQMAPDVPIEVAGGAEGELGTSFDVVSAAMRAADTASAGEGVVVLYDLGSALLTAETALELGDPGLADHVLIVDAPLVEGAVAAAVAAAGGADRSRVADAARRAGLLWTTAEPVEGGASHPSGAWTETSDMETASASAVVSDPDGIHARPAAQLGFALQPWPDAVVTIGRHGSARIDVRDTLRLIALGIRAGERVEVSGVGSGSVEAVRAVARSLTDASEESSGDLGNRDRAP